MFNIMKADLYRIFRGKGIYITLAFVIFITALMVLSNGNIQVMTINTEPETITIGGEVYDLTMSPTGRIAPFQMASSTDILVWFMLPFIVFIAASDFSQGAVKNLLAGGSSRMKYYIAKLILSAVICMVLTLFFIVLSILFGTMTNGFGGRFDAGYVGEVLKVYLPQTFLLFAYTCIGIFLAFTFKKVAVLNTVYIAFAFVPSLTILILSDFSEKFIKLSEYDLYINIKACANAGLVDVDYTKLMILGSAYILTTTIGGMLLFRKSEIK
jgi:ABC-2 type transport system permease protein